MDMIGKSNKTIVHGTSIAWSEMGSGDPLILIHGFKDTHRVWARIAPLLADDFRVIMIDLPGNGLSDRPDASYTLEWYAQMIVAWMDAIGITQAHVCGHSYGGGIAQWLLIEYKNRINRLALVAPGGLGREVFIWLKLATFPIFGRMLTPLVLRYIIPILMYISPQYFGKRELEEIRHCVMSSRIPGTDQAFHKAVGGVINIFGQYMQTRDRANEVDVLPPIAVFWGENDPILPVKHGYSILEHSTGISLTTYPKCGHFPHLDFASTFAHDLKEFLIDPYRPCGHIYSEMKQKELPWIQGNTIQGNTVIVPVTVCVNSI
ncbi:MAG: alpha/beta fold hydrolase [Desulfobacterales bacterium]|nr:alpha/beta fold hydrolase [Desulfobacterales bacterium]